MVIFFKAIIIHAQDYLGFFGEILQIFFQVSIMLALWDTFIFKPFVSYSYYYYYNYIY